MSSYLHSCEEPIIHGNLTCDTIFIQNTGLIKIGSSMSNRFFRFVSVIHMFISRKSCIVHYPQLKVFADLGIGMCTIYVKKKAKPILLRFVFLISLLIVLVFFFIMLCSNKSTQILFFVLHWKSSVKECFVFCLVAPDVLHRHVKSISDTAAKNLHFQAPEIDTGLKENRKKNRNILRGFLMS